MNEPKPKLKPCPCCEAPSDIKIVDCEATGWHYVRIKCTECVMQTCEYGYDPDKGQKAVNAVAKGLAAAWNRRPK